MKIAIFPGFGGCGYPDIISDKIKNYDDWDTMWRVRIAEIIEDIPDTYGVTEDNFYECFRDFFSEPNQKNVFKFKDKMFFVSEYNHVAEIQIVDIDTSRHWKVSEYDGAESVQYFNDIKVVNKITNESEW
ncbi:MAG: hypothetical protein MI784_03000 [Cytophagales bacterium]|nr:hypothetical protein [Cytophagales bacterium]